MSMIMTQVRLPKNLIFEIDKIVENGYYENKSYFIRDAIRKKVFEEQIHSVKLKGNSINEIKKIRSKFSKEKINLDEINSLE